jgi:G:T-mismatch repair DNA endonuclease (very short patch repair protein)
LWFEHRLDPDWVEKIPYYEYQIWLQKLNVEIEKENREAQENSGQSEVFNFSK